MKIFYIHVLKEPKGEKIKEIKVILIQISSYRIFYVLLENEHEILENN